MVDALTSTGLAIDTLENRISALKAALRAAIAANLDLSTDQPQGQFVEGFAEHAQELAELLQEVYTAFDPDEATGQSLTALAALTGTHRQAATYGTAPMTLTLDAVTTAPAGTEFAVLNDPDNKWILDADVTSVGASTYPGTATAATAGAVQALNGTITVIVTPVAGLTAVTNSADATVGNDEETDTDLRLRREIEVTLGGSASVDSIQAALSDLVGMVEVKVYEADTWQGSGTMPPHSIEAVIWDGVTPAVTDADIAEVIFDEKPGGVQAYGTTVVAHEDDQGNEHQIGFTRATQFEIELRYELATDPDVYPGDAVLSAALAAWDEANIGIGGVEGFMIFTRWMALPYELVDGVLSVEAFHWCEKGGVLAVGNIAIGEREIPTVDSGDISYI